MEGVAGMTMRELNYSPVPQNNNEIRSGWVAWHIRRRCALIRRFAARAIVRIELQAISRITISIDSKKGIFVQFC